MAQSQCVAEFRGDLDVVLASSRHGLDNYLVKDPLSGKTFNFGKEEHYLCELLNGNNSLSEVRLKFKERFGLDIEIAQLEAFVRQLGAQGLLAGQAGSPVSLLSTLYCPDVWKSWNLFNPTTLLLWLNARLDWCYTRTFMAASVVLLALALGVLFNNYRLFASDLVVMLTQHSKTSLLRFLAVYYLWFNVPSELLRAATGLRYGARISRGGIRLLMDIVPRFYCEVDFFSIRDKSARGRTLFVPAYYTILSASLGMVLWKMTSPGIALHEFGIMLAVMGAINVIVRLNVLWPTDGSYVLANWLGISGFMNRALSVAKSFILRQPVPEPLAKDDRLLFTVFGVLAGVVTATTIAVILYSSAGALIGSYGGAGAFVILGVLVLMLRKGLARVWHGPLGFIGNTITTNKEGPLKKIKRWYIYVAIIIFLFLPYPYSTGGAFTLFPMHNAEVHTQVEGEVREVMVKEGEMVEKGQMIMLLDTRPYQKDLDVVTANLEKARADLRNLKAGATREEMEKARQHVVTAAKRYEYSKREAGRLKSLYKAGVVSEEEYLDEAKTADLDKENLETVKDSLDIVKSGSRPDDIEAQSAVVKDLETRFKFYQENLELCRVRAPVAGQVVTPYIEKMVGRVMTKGDLVVEIEDARMIQAEILVQESDIGQFKNGAKVRLRPWAYPTRSFYGKVVSIAPNAEQTREGRIVRVISEIDNSEGKLITDMTGEAKIAGGWKPLILAYTRTIVRFFFVEVWSWFP